MLLFGKSGLFDLSDGRYLIFLMGSVQPNEQPAFQIWFFRFFVRPVVSDYIALVSVSVSVGDQEGCFLSEFGFLQEGVYAVWF